MKRPLQVLSLAVIAGASITWLALGANRGWTKTSAPVKTLDEVTGIEEISYEERFMPGLDFLGGAVAAGGLLAGISLFLSKSQKTKSNNNENQVA